MINFFLPEYFFSHVDTFPHETKALFVYVC